MDKFTQSACLHFIMQREHITLKELRTKLGMRLARIRRILDGSLQMKRVELEALIDNYPYVKGRIELGDL